MTLSRPTYPKTARAAITRMVARLCISVNFLSYKELIGLLCSRGAAIFGQFAWAAQGFSCRSAHEAARFVPRRGGALRNAPAPCAAIRPGRVRNGCKLPHIGCIKPNPPDESTRRILDRGDEDRKSTR